MGSKWIPRTSLFARISLTFGLLVAVPLAVSGVLLGMVGQARILDSGDAMEVIGREAVNKTGNRLVTIVDRKFQDVTDQVSRSAETALQQASKKHIQTSDHAV